MRTWWRRLRRAVAEAWWRAYEKHVGPTTGVGFDAWWSFRHRRCVRVLATRPEYRRHGEWRKLCRSCRAEQRWDR